jgi:hypothetical protein
MVTNGDPILVRVTPTDFYGEVDGGARVSLDALVNVLRGLF